MFGRCTDQDECVEEDSGRQRMLNSAIITIEEQRVRFHRRLPLIHNHRRTSMIRTTVLIILVVAHVQAGRAPLTAPKLPENVRKLSSANAIDMIWFCGCY
jgi:hypothetical protein